MGEQEKMSDERESSRLERRLKRRSGGSQVGVENRGRKWQAWELEETQTCFSETNPEGKTPQP